MIGDDELEQVGEDGDVVVLRPASPNRDIVVLHEQGSGSGVLIREADRLGWLSARGPAPELVASGRSDDGDEALVVRLAAGATPLDARPAVDPTSLTAALARALREVHRIAPGPEPVDVGPGVLRTVIADRIARGELGETSEGPYAGRSPAELAGLVDRLIGTRAGGGDAPAVVHGGLTTSRVWVDLDGAITFTGWHGSGVGDRHLDLAAAAAVVAETVGSAAVPSLLDAYGLDEIDPVTLDTYQLIVHLLR